MYKRTKDQLTSEKINPGSLEKLNVKNAVYLNEALKQANSREARKQLQKVMKKMHFYS